MGQVSRKSDIEIQQAVSRELGWDTRVSPAEVGVQVRNGIVTLAGTVDSWAKRVAAEQAAHRVPDVLDVANDLEVQLMGMEKSDSEIAESVRHTLEWDVNVPEKDIRSTVSRGVVTLEGAVPLWSQCHDAEQAVHRLRGVTAVVNKIEIRPLVEADTGEVRAAIQEALGRHAEREAARINVSITNRVVDVAGVVHTWSEKEAVLGAVRGTRGVGSVIDRLDVQPYA